MVGRVVNRYQAPSKIIARAVIAMSLVSVTAAAQCSFLSALGTLLTGGTLVTSEPARPDVINFPSIRIVDENSQPVSDAEVTVKRKDTRFIHGIEWFATNDEAVTTPTLRMFGEEPDGTYEVLVRAPGYVTHSTTMTLPLGEDTLTIPLKRGTQVSIQLNDSSGRAIPADLKPSVFSESWGVSVWLSTQQDMTNLDEKESPLSTFAVNRATATQPAATYTLNIDRQSTEPLYVLINHPGFLRAFQHGPIAPADWASSETLTLNLPAPASLTGVLDLAGNKAESPVVTMEIGSTRPVPGSNNWGLRLLTQEIPTESAQISTNDLAPGKYSVEVVMADSNNRWRNESYSTEESITLDEGASETLTLTYEPFQKEWLQGPYTAKLKILNMQGEPATGAEYKLTWYQRGYPQQTVAEGTVPDGGIVTVENLAGLEKAMTPEEARALKRGLPSFDLQVDGQRIKSIGFFEYESGKYIPDSELVKEEEFRLPPKEGDTAPDFEMHDIATGKSIRLSDLKGQVVLIDFWATWCGPCQGPMAENQAVMRKHKEDWNGKATILAVSIDDELDTVVKHLDKNDWHDTLNTWAAPDPEDENAKGWKSPAAELYGINSIPTMVLLGTDGTIKHRGHIHDIEDAILKELP